MFISRRKRIKIDSACLFCFFRHSISSIARPFSWRALEWPFKRICLAIEILMTRLYNFPATFERSRSLLAETRSHDRRNFVDVVVDHIWTRTQTSGGLNQHFRRKFTSVSLVVPRCHIFHWRIPERAPKTAYRCQPPSRVDNSRREDENIKTIYGQHLTPCRSSPGLQRV